MKQSRLLKSEFVKTAILLLIAVISVAGFWLALRAALRTEYPLHAVISGSMIPSLHVGDLVVVQGGLDPCEIYAAPETGDIIVFRKPTDPSEFIVHRAVNKVHRGNSWFFKTKGDSNLSSDNWEVPDDYVIGKVVGRVPLLGYFKIFLGTPGGMAVIVALILILLFMDYIPLKRKEAKTKN